MLRTALVSASAFACLASPLASSALAAEPDHDFTLTLQSRSVDLALGFEFRAAEHFAWGFDIGASFVDEVGLAIGLDLKYFVAADFQGFYVGFDGAFAAIDGASIDDGITARSHVAAMFGSKWIFDPGFTVDVGVGVGFGYAEEIDSETDTTVTIEPLAPTLVAKLGVGWSF